jgi:hypothetical protein
VGADYLNECSCPLDTALVQLWMVKTTANEDPEIKELYENDEIAASDYHFNPVNLRLVRSMINSISGLTTDNMFSPRSERLEYTIEWALEELSREYKGESGKLITAHLKAFTAMMDDIVES